MLYPRYRMADYPAKTVLHRQLEFLLGPPISETTVQRMRKIRSKAKVSNNLWGKRYIKRRTKGNPPSVYKVGERVLIRFPFSGRTRGIPKKRFVVDGTIIKRNVQLGNYKITYESPTTEMSCCDWVSVEDMTSATAVEETRKRAAARRRISLSKTQKEPKAKKAAHRKKILHRNDA